MTLEAFLAELQALPDPRVLFFQDMASIRELVFVGEQFVFIGCGSLDSPEMLRSSGKPLLLTSKGSKNRFQLASDYTSLTAMIAANPPGLFDGFAILPRNAASPENALAPAQVIEKLTIVAEDAGPDSVFSFFLLLAASAGLKPGDLFPLWRESVDLWERYGNAENPTHSWCALESALVHRRLPSHDRLTPECMSKAWGEALRFLAASLAHNLHPNYLPETSISLEHAMAKAALEQERHAYEQWLQHAHIVQLSLPLTSARDRRIIVDALFIEEGQMTGSAKVFYRNDTTNSPLKKGFAFAAHYRPTSTESKPDITIAVDPRRGVDLDDLHNALEAAEDKAWKGAEKTRSTDHPRYMENVPNIYEQPWYMDREHTLIGSPRRLRSGGYGSLLRRDEVFEIIWQTYNPLNGVLVRPCPNGANPVGIINVLPVHIKGEPTGKNLSAASWPKAEDTALPRSMPNAPVIWRILAAMTRTNSHGILPALNALPVSGNYDYISLNGGFAVITESGAFVLDDWTPESIEWDQIEKPFSAAATLHGCLEKLQNEVERVAESLESHLAASLKMKDVQALLASTARLSTQITQTRGSHALPPSDANARIFRQAIYTRWALDSRLDALEKEVLSLQGALRTSLEIATASTTRFIATFGLAAGLGAALASSLAKWIAAHKTHQPANQDPPGIYVALMFILVTLIAYGILFLWFRRIDLLRRADSRTLL